jgi:RHS repeat-associated protein
MHRPLTYSLIREFTGFIAANFFFNDPPLRRLCWLRLNFRPPAVGETGTARAALNDWGSMVDGGYQSGDPSAPRAHVNIVIFDRNYNFLDAAFEQISDNAEQVGVSPDVDHDYLMKEYTIKEAGFVFVYVSNNSPVNVYFDDVTISHTPTNVIQYSEYYPFGLQTDRSWTRTGSDNDFLYNAGSELNSTTGWYETFFRGYDAALGRFAQVDPVAIASSSQSLYNFGFNNPVLFNDPNGDYPEEVKRDMREHGATGLAQIPDPFEVEIGNPYRIGPGSGNHWADGIGYSDWTLNGGSDTYQAGLAAGMTDIGGQLYYIESDGSRSPWVEKNGEYGIMMDVYDDWYVNGEYVDSYYSYTYFKPVSAQQGGPCKDCPKEQGAGSTPNPESTEQPSGTSKPPHEPFAEGDRNWNEDLEELEKIKNKSYPWNRESYPWYKSVGWGLYETIGWTGDRILWTIDPNHNSVIHPWGYYKDTHREFFYNH